MTNLARAACAAGVMDGCTVATGVAAIATGCCRVGVCSAPDDKSGDTCKTQNTMLMYVA